MLVTLLKTLRAPCVCASFALVRETLRLDGELRGSSSSSMAFVAAGVTTLCLLLLTLLIAVKVWETLRAVSSGAVVEEELARVATGERLTFSFLLLTTEATGAV